MQEVLWSTIVNTKTHKKNTRDAVRNRRNTTNIVFTKIRDVLSLENTRPGKHDHSEGNRAGKDGHVFCPFLFFCNFVSNLTCRAICFGG